ncbi:carbohydrate binding domain-containing protein [Aegicerativicinus sediminis]|uniref:carbohydrate binding domain-containing protein n=1 Tax=Aegicerativicinus sediminis TaxID=2893202 RepID=UPI001E29AF6B|nr:carbohydrate binding domain-containing protein [Aegicerativicinus sediminis]
MLKTLKFIRTFLLIIPIVFAISCEDDDSLIAEVVINSVQPNVIFPGDQVIIEGSNLNEVRFVFIDNDQIPYELDGGMIKFTISESMPIGDKLVTLVMPKGYIVTNNITITPRPFPIISAISTSAAGEGDELTIVGTSLDNLQSVTVGDIEAIVVSSTATELKITIPAGLPPNVPSEVKVTTTGGEAIASGKFWFGDNLLLNGGLESGDGDNFNNWGKWNGGDGMTATTSTGEAYFGRSLKAVGAGGDAWRTQFVSDPVPTVVGAEYSLSIWIKAQAGSPGVGGNIRFSTNPDAMYSGNYDITGEWQQIEWLFTANAEQTRAVLDLGVIANAVYFVDNITLIQTGTPPPPPINTNGSFEDSALGTADGVTGWGGLNGTRASGEITDAESHDGDKSVKMTINEIGTNPWDIQPTSSMTVEDGKTYRLSVWFKGSGISNIKVAIDQGGDPGWAEWAAPESAFTNNQWTEVTYEFTASTTNAGPNNARFAISMSYDGNVGGVIYIDDLEVSLVQ